MLKAFLKLIFQVQIFNIILLKISLQYQILAREELFTIVVILLYAVIVTLILLITAILLKIQPLLAEELYILPEFLFILIFLKCNFKIIQLIMEMIEQLILLNFSKF